MKKKNTGIQYEIFVQNLYEVLLQDERFSTVEHDVKLAGKDGERQIDCLIRTAVAGHNLLIVIECRDYASRLDITHIDGFHSKLQDVNASKGILISRRGFSKNAQNKANRVGITLCMASDATEVLKSINVSFPVRANEIAATFDLKMRIKTTHKKQAISGKEMMIINGVNLQERLQEELLTGVIELPTTYINREWFPNNISPPFHVKDNQGNLVPVDNINITAKFGVKYHYGHLEDVPGLSAMHELSTDNTTLFFKLEDVPNILPALNEFKNPQNIPKTHRVILNIIHVYASGQKS